jgi:predicted nucleotidyltransferase
MVDESEIMKLKPKIVRILKKYKVKKAGIFGSFVRGEQRDGSDIDILIQPVRGMGLEFIGVKLELEDELGRKIDLVTYKGIHPLLRKQILREEVRII